MNRFCVVSLLANAKRSHPTSSKYIMKLNQVSKSYLILCNQNLYLAEIFCDILILCPKELFVTYNFIYVYTYSLCRALLVNKIQFLWSLIILKIVLFIDTEFYLVWFAYLHKKLYLYKTSLRFLCNYISFWFIQKLTFIIGFGQWKCF